MCSSHQGPMPLLVPSISNMHRCLNISELSIQIFEYCALDDLKTVAVLARTCRDFHESALEILWRELEDISPLIKLLPPQLWREVKSNNRAGHTVTTLELVENRPPTREQWERMHIHTKRVQKLTYSHQRDLESGGIYRISWPLLAAFGRYVRRPPAGRGVALLPNLRVLHMDFYDHRKLYVAECFPYLAGRALTELHMHCDYDNHGTDLHDFLELSRAITLLPTMSPNLRILLFHEPRERTRYEPCSGLSIIMSKLRHLRHFAGCSMTMEKLNIIHLAAMQNLMRLSIAIHTELAQSPALPIAPLDYVPFNKLETLCLDVSYLEHATACVGVLGAQTLRIFSLSTPMWQDEATLERCFKAVTKQRLLREFTLRVVARPVGFIFPAQQGVHTCTMSTQTISALFILPDIEILRLSTNDHGRFETDLDDTGIQAMASAWPRLRSLTIVQGSSMSRGVQLPLAQTTMGCLLALRDNCPDLSGLSISLDTTSFDKTILQAAIVSGSGGTSLRKLNIGCRSTPVSNHSFAAQVLHGLFPNLPDIHDGESVAWDHQNTDWQEVGAILRKLTQTPRASLLGEEEAECSDSSADDTLD